MLSRTHVFQGLGQVLEVALLNCTLKRYRDRYKFIKNLIFLFMSQLFCLFIKNILTCEIK